MAVRAVGLRLRRLKEYWRILTWNSMFTSGCTGRVEKQKEETLNKILTRFSLGTTIALEWFFFQWKVIVRVTNSGMFSPVENNGQGLQKYLATLMKVA